MNVTTLKYPLGVFNNPKEINDTILNEWISVISVFPFKLKTEIHSLSEIELDTQYRPEGWTIRQVIHHCADSHMNSFIRLKLALTEEQPTIKPYLEDRWAELPDSRTMSIQSSLNIIEGVHERWVTLLKTLTNDQWKRTFIHPEHGKVFSIDEATGFYAWHCEHHLAHIYQAKKSIEIVLK
jgi:hypothetical protein